MKGPGSAGSNRIALPHDKRLEAELRGATVDLSAAGIRVDGDPHPDLMVAVSIAAAICTEQKAGPDAGLGTPSFPGMAMYEARRKMEAGETDPLQPDLPPDFFDP